MVSISIVLFIVLFGETKQTKNRNKKVEKVANPCYKPKYGGFAKPVITLVILS